ncbi:uncharacterized protein PADG_03532 [Paracoccidioides brasiliensis Pb18]|uniref:Pre-rRNA-processing protein TSR2 n=1 Tax=Paracoccidioides brasiliensis (strain Pb18) TaxID=502780 RepID=C1G8E6_PARBD|nr:uncharacterized protein PADG_03532 [Paracoccidioides brasiliensis Pb18]EEH47448.1 hypothetical protein PADG_03532 [Paracoccidioides brasiliensis Pb18]
MATTATLSTQQPSEKQQEQAVSKDASAQFDLGITLVLNSWPALNLAVHNSWGGPASGDKRDWLCGAISDLFVDRPETDAEDVEDVLIQVMNDEFEVVVEDESAGEVARRIIEVRAETGRGEFGRVTRMWEEWKRKRGAGVDADADASIGAFRKVEVNGDEDDDDDDDDGDDDDDIVDWADDVEMEDASTAPMEVSKIEPAKETKKGIHGQWERGKFLPEPVVDEDGFTKVVSKRRR